MKSRLLSMTLLALCSVTFAGCTVTPARVSYQPAYVVPPTPPRVVIETAPPPYVIVAPAPRPYYGPPGWGHGHHHRHWR